MKRAYILLALLCQTIFANALTMKGKVTTESHEVLPYATVFITDLQIGATTDLDGRYRISDIPAGNHTMVVSYVGYETQTFQFNLDKDGLRDFTLLEQEVTLNELFVTPTGQSIERFILDQVVKHTRPLSKVVNHFDLTKRSYSEQRGESIKPLFEPYMKVMNTVLGILGFRNVFHYMIDNPNCKMEFLMHATYDKGTFNILETSLGECNPMPTDEQKKSFLKLFAKHDAAIGYDKTYDQIASIRKDILKIEKKSSDELAKALSYIGGYEENGHTIHILGTKEGEFHIVDGCWQVRRAVLKSKNDRTGIVEFCEFSKDVYLPISQYTEASLGMENIIQKEIDDQKKELPKMKASTAEKTREHIAKLEHILQSESLKIKSSIAYEYKDLK